MRIHRIKENEDIYSLSREYSISPAMLMDNNGVYGVKRPPVNTEILIATPTRTYNVRRGDSLSAIAKRFDVKTEYLKQINPSFILLLPINYKIDSDRIDILLIFHDFQ